MTTKLTLNIDDRVIDEAKQYAKNNGKSLSEIVESYLKSLTSKDKNDNVLSPRILKLMGSVRLPENFEYKKSIFKAIIKKHQR
jgi:hypothetical protein